MLRAAAVTLLQVGTGVTSAVLSFTNAIGARIGWNTNNITIDSNKITFTAPYTTGSTTVVGSLVAAGTAGAGARAFVTDATATTFGSIVAGSGANKVPVYCDGTNWLIG